MAKDSNRESQKPVSREEWYSGQKYQADTIKEMQSDLKELRQDIRTIADDVKSILTQTTKTNGRVTTLEETAKSTSIVAEDYKVNKTRVWTTIVVGGIFLATIVSLSILAIDNKIETGIRQAFLTPKS